MEIEELILLVEEDLKEEGKDKDISFYSLLIDGGLL